MSNCCPVCGREPKPHKTATGYILSCVGDRHTVALYRSDDIDELKAAWPRFFPEKVPA